MSSDPSLPSPAAGTAPPPQVFAVLSQSRAQLERQPLHSQELVDPLRAYAAAVLCRSMPGALRGACRHLILGWRLRPTP